MNSPAVNSCLYEGQVHHRRHAPVGNAFRYSMFMVFLDLGDLADVFDGRWFWSTKRPALAWFRRADHLGAADRPLDDCVRDLVEAELDRRPAGPVRLLTNLRYFGYVMNPVSFYYCFDEDDEHVEAIVAEVHNTPWGERHCYVLDGRAGADDGVVRRHFRKVFHVSPFMGMDQEYRWRLGTPGDRLDVHMENHESGEKLFEATMGMRRVEMTRHTLARVLVRYPLMTVKIVAAIYYQALWLWWKRCPFHPHPPHLDPNLDPNPDEVQA